MRWMYALLGIMLVALAVSAQAADETLNEYEMRSMISAMQQEQRAFYTAYNDRINEMETNMTAVISAQVNYGMDQKFAAFNNKITTMIEQRVNPLNFAPAYVLCVVMGIAVGGILVSWRNSM